MQKKLYYTIAIFFLGGLVLGTALHKIPKYIPIVYLLVSLVTMMVYILDKNKAKNAQWRTPEEILHLLELACGWPGAMLAQMLFNHKKSKISYQIVFWLMIISNCGVLFWYIKYRV